MSAILIQPWDESVLPEGLAALHAAAQCEGYRFLSRINEECGPGGIFRRPDGCLFWVQADGVLVGVGGLTRDPYDDTPGILRMRHVFLKLEYRRNGIGRALALAIIQAAVGRASRLTLRTPDERASRFWESLGFQPVRHPSRSHEMNLTKAAPPPLQPTR